MVKYTATFPTGETVTINSIREPRTAWAIIDKDNKIVRHGFSANLDNANKTARGYLPSFMPMHYRSNLATTIQHHIKQARKHGFKTREAWYEDCRRKTEEERKKFKVIFADAKILVAF